MDKGLCALRSQIHSNLSDILLFFPNQVNHLESKAYEIMPLCWYINRLFEVKRLWYAWNNRHARGEMTQNIWDIGVTIKVIYFDRTAQEIERSMGLTDSLKTVKI